jgi:hypothetical protein
MEHWQHLTVTLDSAELHPHPQFLPKAELAQRLSEALIDTVQSYKREGWELVNMEFNAGRVRIHFRQPR